MNLQELKQLKFKNLGISREKFGKIYSFVDFGNVNYWFHRDKIGPDAAPLTNNQRLIVDLEKLSEFLSFFSEQKRFYYGWHRRLSRSQHIIIKAEKVGFIKITKPIQYIKHYIYEENEFNGEKSRILKDTLGAEYIEIPKSNFDVEITLDALRLKNEYDTLCLFSGDSDFVRLVQFLVKEEKQVIIVASGQVYYALKKSASLYINAQQIKSFIVSTKEITPHKGRDLDI
ncbi:MAG: NYN domain-containing protein [Minisyncoccia bacterium]|jgi:uncharacterized LabA/DUF88 family protein